MDRESQTGESSLKRGQVPFIRFRKKGRVKNCSANCVASARRPTPPAPTKVLRTKRLYIVFFCCFFLFSFEPWDQIENHKGDAGKVESPLSEKRFLKSRNQKVEFFWNPSPNTGKREK